MPTDEQRKEAAEFIKVAFRCFTEARRHLTIFEFQEAIASRLAELGSRGFVASVGAAIGMAAEGARTSGEHLQEGK